MARIAVDAMGGDHAPAVVVEGAVQARRQLGVDVVLVGDEARIRGELARLGAADQPGISVRHTTEVVEMSEHPGQALRKKKDSSLRVIFELVKAGEADACMSAGNSGGMLAAALFVLGRLPEVERPAIATFLPTLTGRMVLVDAGANVDVRPLHVAQFAVMGEAYARLVAGVANPKVGVLSNGEEASKGTALTRAAAEALARAPGLNFAGYAEGKDLFTGEFDVVATDGFTGNVVLKTTEGVATAFATLLKQGILSSVRTKIGGLLIRPALAEMKRKLDYSEYGGAPLVGCDGTVIIAHGRSNAVAIRNAIRAAAEASRHDSRAEISAACARVRGLVTEAA
jgi:glycerol-3-phosphate acyltransferase PlsX